MKSIRDQCILLTGASRGVGAVMAQTLAERGAHLALVARSREGLQQVAEALAPPGGRVHVLAADLTDDGDRFRVVNQVRDRFGRIDILINNAAIESEGAFLDLSLDDIRRTVELNLVAPMALTSLVLPHMLARGSGHVVNIASIGGKSGGPYDAVYCGTKAGLAQWARGLRLELEGTGVDFATIFPGFVTEVGMFARFGIKTPWAVGSCTPGQVAAAVVRAIQHGKREMIVNSRPLRPIFVLSELFPAFGDWLMHRLGVVAFQRRKVGAASQSKPS